MGWWLLRLSANILALLRISANFNQLRLINLYFLYLKSKIKVFGSSRDEKF